MYSLYKADRRGRPEYNSAGASRGRGTKEVYSLYNADRRGRPRNRLKQKTPVWIIQKLVFSLTHVLTVLIEAPSNLHVQITWRPRANRLNSVIKGNSNLKLNQSSHNLQRSNISQLQEILRLQTAGSHSMLGYKWLNYKEVQRFKLQCARLQIAESQRIVSSRVSSAKEATLYKENNWQAIL